MGIVNVLVAAHSFSAATSLAQILDPDPAFRIVARVSSGAAAVAATAELRPDVVLMDLQLPGVSGVEATAAIMERTPTPIVIVSREECGDQGRSPFDALQAGAVAVVKDPFCSATQARAEEERKLRETVRLMAEVKVVSRRRRLSGPPPQAAATPRISRPVVAIGASTGGPPVLRTILLNLPRDFSAPLLIVQHISPGFVAGLQSWLGETTGFEVVIASHLQQIQPARAFLAPDGRHMGINLSGQIVLSDGPPEYGVRPSVAHLFRAVTRACASRAIGILLTGMGIDGARELRDIKVAGGVTIAQDRDSAVIPSMPAAAVALNAAMHIMDPVNIALALPEMVRTIMARG